MFEEDEDQDDVEADDEDRENEDEEEDTSCPYCQQPLSNECEHLIALVSAGDAFGYQFSPLPFTNTKRFENTLRRFLTHIRLKKIWMEFDWSENQQAQACRDLLPIYQRFASRLQLPFYWIDDSLPETYFNETDDTNETDEAIRINAMMGTFWAEMFTPSQSSEHSFFESYEKYAMAGYGLGCYSANPEEARVHYTRYAESFMIALEALMMMEPQLTKQKA